MYLAIDPGTKNTGWALFDSEGVIKHMGVITGVDNFLDWLEEQEDIRVYIVERYRMRPGKTNAWSTGGPTQIIGAIKRVAHKRHIRVIEQDPSPALSIGLRFIGMADVYKGKHVPDQISAYAHGTYYLRKAGIQK